MPEQFRIIIICTALLEHDFFSKYNKLHRCIPPYSFFILISVAVISSKTNISTTIVM